VVPAALIVVGRGGCYGFSDLTPKLIAAFYTTAVLGGVSRFVES
jgi:hypothetical protein